MDPLTVALLLYIAALGLASVDIFVPSGGMLLILASLAAFAAVLFGFRAGSGAGLGMLIVVLGSVPVFLFATIKVWPVTPIGRRVILALPKQELKGNDASKQLEQWLGQVHVVDAPLLPSGQIRIGHRRLGAIAEAGIIETGQRVKIVAIRERNLIVRPTNEPLTVVTRGASRRTDQRASPENSQATPTQPPAENLLDLPAEQLGLDSLDER